MTQMAWRKLADVAIELGYEAERTPIPWPPRLTPNAIPWPKSVGSWERLFNAQKGKCYWCRRPMSRESMKLNINGDPKPNDGYATEEHLLRRRDGGRRTPGNIVLAHGSCNRNRDRKNHLPRYAHDPYPIHRASKEESSVDDRRPLPASRDDHQRDPGFSAT